jgi:hypothetical protein
VYKIETLPINKVIKLLTWIYTMFFFLYIFLDLGGTFLARLKCLWFHPAIRWAYCLWICPISQSVKTTAFPSHQSRKVSGRGPINQRGRLQDEASAGAGQLIALLFTSPLTQAGEIYNTMLGAAVTRQRVICFNACFDVTLALLEYTAPVRRKKKRKIQS